MKESKYNFVIGVDLSSLNKYCWSDLNTWKSGVIDISDLHKTLNWKYPLFRVHLGPEINKFVNLPFKSIWNLHYIKEVNFDNKKPICFILSGSYVKRCFEFNLINTIRNKFPGCKVIWYLSDLVIKQWRLYAKDKKKEIIDINKAKETFDLITSFDQGDCEKYGLLYHPLVYSSFHEINKNYPKSDVYFCGKAKDRFKEIIKIYEILRERGLQLDFNLMNVPKNQQIYPNEIKYHDKFMDYNENIQHILSTKCLLEIMQHGGRGFTLRANETVGFGKKLLTNNPTITEAPFYTSEYISIFDSTNFESIDKEFVKNIPKENENIDYHYKDKMSPLEYLQFIENHL